LCSDLLGLLQLAVVNMAHQAGTLVGTP